MLALNARHADILRAARTVGVRLYDLRPVHVPRGYSSAYRFTLKTDSSGSTRRAPYRRLSQFSRYANGTPRTVPGAVCWHGHRDFFRALFALAPDAEIRTGLATYRGREHFESTYEGTREEVSDYYGTERTPYDEACTC